MDAHGEDPGRAAVVRNLLLGLLVLGIAVNMWLRTRPMPPVTLTYTEPTHSDAVECFDECWTN